VDMRLDRWYWIVHLERGDDHARPRCSLSPLARHAVRWRTQWRGPNISASRRIEAVRAATKTRARGFRAAGEVTSRLDPTPLSSPAQ